MRQSGLMDAELEERSSVRPAGRRCAVLKRPCDDNGTGARKRPCCSASPIEVRAERPWGLYRSHAVDDRLLAPLRDLGGVLLPISGPHQ